MQQYDLAPYTGPHEFDVDRFFKDLPGGNVSRAAVLSILDMSLNLQADKFPALGVKQAPSLVTVHQWVFRKRIPIVWMSILLRFAELENQTMDPAEYLMKEAASG